MSSPRDANRAFRSVLSALDLAPSDDAFATAGHQAAVAFALFAEWVAEQVSESDIDSVFLLSREGPFLEEVIRHAEVTLPSVKVLEVSRVATFLPSMPDFTTPTMMRMWERFPLQSPASMLAGIGLDKQMFTNLLDQFDLDPDVEIHEPWSDRRVVGFLESFEFVERASAERDEARELLLGYLQQMGYLESRSVALVDVGWRGTIQDSLARLTPSIRSTGLLLAHRPANLAQYANTSKAGFLAGERADGRLFGQELRMAASPLEMLSTCPGGSSVAYDRVGSDVVAIHRPIEAEEQFLRSEVQRFQSAVLAAIDAMGGVVEADASVERRSLARASLKSVLFDPDPAIVACFEDYQLDPSIGGFGPTGTPGTGVGAMLTAAGRQSAKERIQRHGWPHAIVKRRVGERAYSAALKSARWAGEWGRWLI